MSQRHAPTTSHGRLPDASPTDTSLPAPGSLDAEYPLSHGQRALWFLHQLDPTTPANHLVNAARVHQNIDIPAFTRALQRLAQRHPLLRTTFSTRNGKPRQRVHKEARLELRTEDVSGFSSEAFCNHLQREAFRPFDLVHGPLMRVVVYSHAPQEHTLLWVIHHLISDLWSTAIFLHEFGLLYHAERSGQPIALREPRRTYSDHVHAMEELLSGPEGSRQQAYWLEQLAGELAPLNLPTDRTRPRAQTFWGAVEITRLDRDLTDSLRLLAKQERTSLHNLLLAAFSALLYRYSGQEDILVGVMRAGRSPGQARTFGYFVNPVVVRAQVSGDAGFASFLEHVHKTEQGAAEHDQYPFPLLVEALQPTRDPKRSPIFQVAFAWQKTSRLLDSSRLTSFVLNEPGTTLDLGGLVLESLALDQRVSQFDLSLMVAEGGPELVVQFEYNTDLFEATTIRRLLGHFQTLLRGIVANPDAAISQLPLLTAEERRQQLVHWNQTTTEYPSDQSLQQLFEAQVARTPAAPAVCYQTQTLTYEALNRRANQLAHYLLRQGVGPETVVGLCLERSLDAIVAILGIIKAGAAYLPIDPTYPPERIAFMVEDAGIQVLLASESTNGRISESADKRTGEGPNQQGPENPFADSPVRSSADSPIHTLLLDAEWPIIAQQPNTNPEAAANADSLAYLLYTSGSTGVPKGVAVAQRAVARLVLHTDYIRLSRQDRVAQASTLAFDAATFEIWGALLTGAELVVISREAILSPRELAHQLQAQGITTVFLTTAVFNLLAREAPDALRSLRYVLFGGEAADPSSVQWVLAHSRPAKLLHMYGPTENTAFSTWHPVERLDSGASSLPIGRPIANTQAYVVDRHLQPVPVGVVGQLLVAGDGLARGYWRRPSLTAERFMPNPFLNAERGMQNAEVRTQDWSPTREIRSIRSQNPFRRSQNPLRLYATGDLARQRSDGSIEFVGRTDHQVKLRGFRIELGEIEARLVQHPKVRGAVVLARSDVDGQEGISLPGDKTLVAYVAADGTLDAAKLTGFLAQALPAYMVPSIYVTVDAFPLGPTGKVDRLALPAPSRVPSLRGPQRTLTPIEELVAGVWNEVLGVQDPAPDDSFFDLGGHSLLATQVISRLRRALAIELPLKDLFEAPTLAGVAERVEAHLQQRSPSWTADLPIVPQGLEGDLPLSYAQQRLWFLHQLERASPTYHVPAAVRLRGPLDVAALQRSLQIIVQRHSSLRTTFTTRNGRPVQVIQQHMKVSLPLHDLTDRPGDQREEDALALATADARQGFDLERGPLLRGSLYKLGHEHHLAVLTMHHIVSDGWSLSVLIRELAQLYEALIADPATDPGVGLPPLPVQYADFARWQRDWLEGNPGQGSPLQQQLAYWRRQLQGPPAPLRLLSDRPRPAKQTYRGARHTFVLSRSLVERLRTLSRKEQATLFMVLLAAFKALLHRHTGQDDICVGTAIANRTQRETESLIGFFANTLALRTDLGGDPTFLELLGRVRAMTLEAYAHQDVPFERVVDAVQPQRDLARSPLFQAFFAQNALLEPLALANLTLTPVEIDLGTVKFDLAVSLEERHGQVLGSVGYNADLFDQETVERIFRQYQVLLNGIVRKPTSNLSTLPLLDEPEAQQMLTAWNTTAVARLRVPVHRLFEAQARRTPAAIAVLQASTAPYQGNAKDASLTYQELNRRANQLAHYLRRLGVGPETLVALQLERSPDLVVGLLGTLKAGGAYLPLDPSYPQERLAFMLEDAGVRVLLTSESANGRISESANRRGDDRPFAHARQARPAATWSPIRRILLDHDWPTISQEPDSDPDWPLDEDHPAYVIYTSGSTGQPKGVQITHGALSNYVQSAADAFQLCEKDRVLQFASLSFDAAAEEIYPTLASGAILVLRDDAMISSTPTFLQTCARLGVTVLDLPTAYWHELTRDLAADELEVAQSLRLVIIGGERARPELLAAWCTHVPSQVRLLNTYGPTEGTIVATAWPAPTSPGDHALVEVPIGRPVDNVQAYVLDRQLNPAPVGVPGELYLSGAGLARGYLRRPALTAERFIPNPFAEGGDQPSVIPDQPCEIRSIRSRNPLLLYRTGDLARWLPDGNLQYLGRVDSQVKIRGYRVELGEVEAALRRHPALTDALVVATDNGASPQLVAYVVSERKTAERSPQQMTAPNTGELRSFLANLLPPHMLPAAYVSLENLPLTASGKVDYGALPPPNSDQLASGQAYVAPRTRLEQALAQIWQDVLGIEQIGIHDNFFDLGGDSLNAAVLINRLQKALNTVIYVVVLFDSPTIAELAETLQRDFGPTVATWLEPSQSPPARVDRPSREAVVDPATLEATDRYLAGHDVATPRETAFLRSLSAKNPPAVFILSAPRAGSTLLRVMLAGHPRLFAPPELALLSFQTLADRRARFSGRDSGWLEGALRTIMELAGCDLEAAREMMAGYEQSGLTTQRFYREIQDWIGDRQLVDKTTLYALSLQTLQRAEAYFEDPLYIHLVREPSATVHSYLSSNLDQVFGHGLSFSARQKAELFWLVANRNLLQFLQGVPESRHHLVRFEDLVSQPELVAREICRFLGLEFVPALLEPYAGNRMTDGVHPQSRMVGDPRFLEHDAVDSKVAQRWANKPLAEPLSVETLQLARSFGYAEPSAASATIPVSAVQEKDLPLSYAQQRLWFFDQLEPGGFFYNMPGALRLNGALDVPALQASLNEIVRRHSVLRTCFPSIDGRPHQVVVPEAPVPLPLVDLRQLPEGERQPEVQRLLLEEAHRPFDLTQVPLLRARLLQLADEDYVVVFNMHHIVSDGWSIGVLVRELAAIYGAFAAGQASPLPPLPIQYSDFARWQRDWLSGTLESNDGNRPSGSTSPASLSPASALSGDRAVTETPLTQQLSYWKRQLAASPALLELPSDRSRPAIKGWKGATIPFEIEDRVAAALRDLGRQEDATLFMTLLAAFQLLLHRYSGQDDICVGTAIANRNRAELEALIGFFVNTLVMRADLSGNPSFRQFLHQVRARALEAYANQDVPFEILVEVLQPERELNRSPLFQAMFLLQSDRLADLQLPNLAIEPLEFDPGFETFDLTMIVQQRQGRLRGLLSYDTALFGADAMTRLVRHFQVLLEGIIADPEAPVGYLPLLSQTERDRQLLTWAHSRATTSTDATVVSLFEAQAARKPDALAVVHPLPQAEANESVTGGVRLTYDELNRRANRLAHLLRARGVGPEDVVGICVERSPDLLVAVLAVLKAGAAYLPLDPSYPVARIGYMIEDAGAKALLGQKRLVEGLNVSTLARSNVFLDTEWPNSEQYPDSNPEPAAAADSLAYVIYTSGSTGRAKGVMISHRSLANAYQAWNQAYRLESEVHSHLQMASFAFDVFTGDMVRALCSGGKLVLCPRTCLLEPARLYELMHQEDVDCAEFVPAVLRQLSHYLQDTQQALAFLRILVVGSDSWYAGEHQAFLRFCGPRTRLIHGFGLTETTIDSCCFEGEIGDARLGGQTREPSGALPERLAPIGQPLGNTQLYALDRHLQPVPVGVPGELYIGGLGVARGYLRHPGLTAERFIPNPFAGSGDQLFVPSDPSPTTSHQPESAGIRSIHSHNQLRLYRTGDLVRWRPDGNLELLGRADHQLKIRGYRVEPGEIEAILQEHPLVLQAVVVARLKPGSAFDADTTAAQQLVAYAVTRGDVPPEEATLRQYLEQQVANYMVPARFVFLEALPLTHNGKVDRSSLPEPDWLRHEAMVGEQAPRTPSEELVAAIWSQLLGLEQVGVDGNFFALGGHSLLATQLLSRINQAFDVQLPLTAVFETPTVSGLARQLDRLRAQPHGPDRPPIRARTCEEHPPLSYAQQRLWFLDQLQDGDLLYNIPVVVRLTGALNDEALRRSLNEIVARHSVLRANFATVDGRPEQIIASRLDLALPVVDLQHLPPDESEATARQLATDEARRVFNLAHEPLVRAQLLRLSRTDHVLVLVLHHIVSDGWSIHVLVRELTCLYRAFAGGQPSPLAELPVQYADFARWQRDWLEHDEKDPESRLRRQLAYWRQQLRDLPPVLSLPTDRPRPAVRSTWGSSLSFQIPADLTSSLRRLGVQEGATLFMTLLAAFQALLHRYSGQLDIPVGTVIANRSPAEIEGLIGFLVNTLVLRGDLSEDPSFRVLLSRVRSLTLEALDHQDVPFEMLVNELQPERHLGQTPLFQVAFTLEQAPGPLPSLGPDVTAEPWPVASATAKHDILMALTEEGAALSGTVEYSTDLFDAATIQRLSEHYVTLLREATADPGRRVSKLAILPESERQCILGWASGRKEPPEERCAHQLFEAQARQAPDAVALAQGDQLISYAALDAEANRLARHLQGRGVGPETLVGICMRPSVQAIAGVLGVLKAGAAFLPLDPTYPRERIAFMIEDAGIQVLLASESTNRRMGESANQRSPHYPITPTSVHTLLLDADWPIIAQEPATSLSVNVAPENLAYVIYTSGSTGRPKGTMLSHAGLVNLVAFQRQAFGLKQGKRVLQFASLAYDASIWEIFMALGTGATLCLPDSQSHRAGPGLLELIEAMAVTTATLPPSLLAALDGEAGSMELPNLETIIAAGEACPQDIVARWSALGKRRFFNAYGPTETTVCATLLLCDPATGQDPPIGRPLDNFDVYVVDKDLQLAPVGIPGELLIGGVGLARGYLHRPGLTAERFIPNPFTNAEGTHSRSCNAPRKAQPGVGEAERRTQNAEASMQDGSTTDEIRSIRSRNPLRPFHNPLRLYRTGDLVRWLPDGTIHFLGRIDHQVKIRGFRIELGEIEATLRDHAGIREAVVAVHENESASPRLVAYVVPAKGQPMPPVADLQTYLEVRLPAHMIPIGFMGLDALPLTPSGKVDRRALPAVDHPAGSGHDSETAPQSSTERILASIWSRVLGMDQIGRHDNFFQLGGDSILAIQVVAQANQAGLRLIPRQLFQAPTVAGLAASVSAAPLIAAEQGPIQGPLALTPIQRWFFEQDLQAPHHWNQSLLLRVARPLADAPLLTALRELLSHHDALRQRFRPRGGEWRAHHAPIDEQVPLTIVDLSQLGEAELRQAIEARCAQAQAGLDLVQGPLLRAIYFKLGSDRHDRLLLVAHHLVVDAFSWRILLEDLLTAYEQASQGRLVRLAPKTTSYRSWAQRLLAYADSGEVRSQVDFWAALAQDVSDSLPVDHPEGDNTVASAAQVQGFLAPDDTLTLLRGAPGLLEASAAEALLASLALALVQWTQGSKLLIDVEGHGRQDLMEDIDLSRTVGWFTSLYPLSLQLDLDASPHHALQATRHQLRAIPESGTSYGLLRYLASDSGLSAKVQDVPAPPVSFNYLGQFDDALLGEAGFTLAQESPGPEQSPENRRSHVLELSALVVDGQMRLVLTYSQAIHDDDTMARLMEAILANLRTLVDLCRSKSAMTGDGTLLGTLVSPEELEVLLNRLDPGALPE